MYQKRIKSAAIVLALLAAACGSNGGGDDDDDDDTIVPDAGPCEGLECFQVTCGGNATSSVSGTVYAPNGTLPLYNVAVYVPTGWVDPFPTGVTCDRCAETPGDVALVHTTTDENGHFVLKDMPVTSEVPLVIQVGKWRRQIVVDRVRTCIDTELPAADTRLPKDRSEGDLPQMALTTGGADALECLFRKIGIDDSEFTTPFDNGRVHLYAGSGGTPRFDDNVQGGASFPPASELWEDVESLSAYDVVMLSCEGGAFPETKPAGALRALHDYAGLGGRVFASHLHSYWLEQGPPPWPDVLEFRDLLPDLGDIEADVDTELDRGAAISEWLYNVGASTVEGKIDISEAQHTVVGYDDTLADRWIYKDITENDQPSIQYLSFTAPLEVEEKDRCGRVVFSDIHVSSGDDSAPILSFPSGGCVSELDDLSPQEKVLAFMIFDIASCIQPPVE
jgi:hypothetical protein